MKTLGFVLLSVLMMVMPSRGVVLTFDYFANGDGPLGSWDYHNGQAGWESSHVTIRAFVPNGSADGLYTLRTLEDYHAGGYITVSGGVSNHADAAHALVIRADWLGENQSIHPAIYKPDGTLGASIAVTTGQATWHFNSSQSVEEAKPGGRFRDVEKGPVDLTTAGAPPPPKTATLKVKVLNQDTHSHTVQFIVNGTVVSTQTVAARTVGAPGTVQTLTFAGDETSMANGSGWGVTVDGVAASAVEGGQVAYGDPPANYAPLFPPQITIQQSSPGGSTTTTPTPGAPNTSTTPPPATPTPTAPPDPGPHTTIANGGAAPNTQDIYEAVLAALKDSMTTTAPAADSTTLPDDTLDTKDSDRAERGHLDDVQSEIDGATSDAGSIKSGLLAKADFASHASGIPSGTVGTVTTVSFGSLSIGGTAHELSIDISPLLEVLAKCRAAILFIMQVLFLILCAHTVLTHH